jgi:hypothetical protein
MVYAVQNEKIHAIRVNIELRVAYDPDDKYTIQENLYSEHSNYKYTLQDGSILKEDKLFPTKEDLLNTL